MLRRILFSFLLALIIVPTALGREPVSVHVFVREECTHCRDQKAFFAELSKRRHDFIVVEHDIHDAAERATFDRLTELAALPKATPVTFIDGAVLQGFSTADTTGVRIEHLIDAAKDAEPVTLEDVLDGSQQLKIHAGDTACDESGATPCEASDEYLVHVPLFGTVDLAPYSLPVISAILGFIDGFNPCAMWVLVTFLIILLQVGDWRKVLQVAGLFLIAETVMYYLILNVWFTTWDFIGMDKYVTPIVGLIAITAGCFFLYEGIWSDGTCKITSHHQRRKVHHRISAIVTTPFTLATAVAVVALALSVNVIEFACSIGIPQTFTKILDLNDLSFASRQAMMAIYILMYMIDDFIVFGLALWGSEHLHRTQAYSRISNVVGGALMLLLGALLILAPEILRFT